MVVLAACQLPQCRLRCVLQVSMGVFMSMIPIKIMIYLHAMLCSSGLLTVRQIHYLAVLASVMHQQDKP